MSLPPLADPERMLSLAYAPRTARAGLHALWLLDERLAVIVTEPNRPIAAIKLAWWREALERLDTAPPPAEPLLAALATALAPPGASGRVLARIAAGWDALIDDEAEADADRLVRHARLRGEALFTAAAAILGGEGGPLAAAGACWAAASVPASFADPSTLAAMREAFAIPPAYWPRPLRSLGMLAALGRARLRDPAGRPGAPARIGRALWLGISGR